VIAGGVDPVADPAADLEVTVATEHHRMAAFVPHEQLAAADLPGRCAQGSGATDVEHATSLRAIHVQGTQRSRAVASILDSFLADHAIYIHM
jgi:hypothetical protein